jgi:hypothetical protein
MRRLRPILTAGLLFAAGAASAAEHPLKSFFPGTDTCFSRVYDKQHLAKHPKQRVSSIQIVHPFPYATSPGRIDYRMALRFKLKGKRGDYGPISVYCEAIADGTASCFIEGDGGRLKLSKGANDTLVVTVERLELEGEFDVSPDLAKGGDDRVLVLRRAPMSACPNNKPEE